MFNLEKKIGKCAPKIWKKYNLLQKELWTRFYKDFMKSELYHTKIANSITQEELFVNAHNFAITAVDTIGEMLNDIYNNTDIITYKKENK